MKKILLSLLCMLTVLSGCSSKPHVKDMDKKGSIVAIDYASFKQKVNNNDTFIIMVTQTSCGYCKKQEKTVKKVLKNHHVKFYNLDVLKEKDKYKVWDKLKASYKDFEGTPFTIVYKDGEVKFSECDELDEKTIIDLIDKYNLYIK